MEKNEHLSRMLLIMEHYGLNQRRFAIKIGVTPQSLNTMIVRDSELKASTLVGILHAFEEVSIEWLVLGTGEMIRKETDAAEVADAGYVAHLEAEVEYLRRQNTALLDCVKGKVS